MKRLLCALVLVLCACSHDTSGATHDATPQVALSTVRYGEYTETIQAIGRVGSSSGAETKLSFALPGILSSVDVRIGEHVAAGEALAQLDTSGLAMSATQAQADAQAAAAAAQQSAVDRTSTRLTVDEASLRREHSLYAAGVAAYKDVQAAQAQVAQDHADIATAHAAVTGAGAQLRSAQARAQLAQRDLANGTLRAPADGIVTGIFKRPGEAVDTSTPVIAIAPGSANEITLSLSAADAARVRPGDAVALTVTGTSLRSTGRVQGVSASLDPVTQTADVIVSGVPPGAPGGSAVEASIAVAHDRGIVIPESAIVQDPQTGQTLVFVQSQGKSGVTFAQRTVRVDKQNGALALISSGLRPGERIASQGAFALLAPSGGD